MLAALGFALNGLAALIFALYVFPLARLSGRLAPLSARIGAVATRINETVASGVKWFALGLVLIEAAVVLLRYVFSISFLWMQDAIIYLHGALFLLAAGYALHVGAHVRVDVFRRAMSDRRKALVDFIGVYVLLAPVAAAILIAAGPWVAQSWAVQEGSAEGAGLGLVYVLKSFIPAFAVLVALQGLALADRSAAALRREREAAA